MRSDDGSKSSSDIAEVLRLDPALTYRSLRALASLEPALHEDANGSFALSACGERSCGRIIRSHCAAWPPGARTCSFTSTVQHLCATYAMANRIVWLGSAIRYSCMSSRIQTTGLCSTLR